ncbi:MAG: hypothetical protein DCC67_10520 [Planctomycetota bacterium]|nr:MAG: hypothetical protein DCC67_10520 [Planctomycetota bacterium]
MSDQIPVPAALPPLEIRSAALLQFTIEMAAKLREFEARFAEHREHPRIVTAERRASFRRPR